MNYGLMEAVEHEQLSRGKKWRSSRGNMEVKCLILDGCQKVAKVGHV